MRNGFQICDISYGILKVQLASKTAMPNDYQTDLGEFETAVCLVLTTRDLVEILKCQLPIKLTM